MMASAAGNGKYRGKWIQWTLGAGFPARGVHTAQDASKGYNAVGSIDLEATARLRASQRKGRLMDCAARFILTPEHAASTHGS